MSGNYCKWCGKKLCKKSINDSSRMVFKEISICLNESCDLNGIEQIEEIPYLNLSNALRLSEITIGANNEKEQIDKNKKR